jgi:hypothetical protein
MLYACPAVLFMRSQLRCAVALNLRQQQQQQEITLPIRTSDMHGCKPACQQNAGCTTPRGKENLLAFAEPA